MKEYLQWFFNAFEYPAECGQTLLTAYDRLYADAASAARFDELLSRYEQNIECDLGKVNADMRQLLEDVQINEYTGMLLLYICLSKTLRECYRREGVDESIWFTSMCDLKYKTIEDHLIHGVWGTCKANWFGRFFRMGRFGFEKLQFELTKMDRDVEANGLRVEAGTPVVNIHIPRTGSRLDEESMNRAFAQAAAFFRERYHLDRIIFHCGSWLLYPKNLEILSETSNLRRFIGLFNLYDQGVYEDYREVWRLFDKEYTGDVDALPQDSSFRRGYADWIRKGIPTGYGCGVFVYEK